MVGRGVSYAPCSLLVICSSYDKYTETLQSCNSVAFSYSNSKPAAMLQPVNQAVQSSMDLVRRPTRATSHKDPRDIKQNEPTEQSSLNQLENPRSR